MSKISDTQDVVKTFKLKKDGTPKLSSMHSNLISGMNKEERVKNAKAAQKKSAERKKVFI